jgi:hypothetical protein
MARVCVRHPFEHSYDLCGHCGLEFCRDCLVRPARTAAHALCVPCALAASGVRSSAGNRPTLSKRELKKRIKERREEEKALARLERPAELPSIANPFSPGWAITDEESAPAATLPPPPPPPRQIEPDLVARDEVPAVDRPPTLADLLPTMVPREESHAAALASLPTREQELGWDEQGDPEEPDRSRRGIGLLRRRDAEPNNTGQESSEMIAWLDEVFAPRDQ